MPGRATTCGCGGRPGAAAMRAQAAAAVDGRRAPAPNAVTRTDEDERPPKAAAASDAASAAACAPWRRRRARGTRRPCAVLRPDAMRGHRSRPRAPQRRGSPRRRRSSASAPSSAGQSPTAPSGRLASRRRRDARTPGRGRPTIQIPRWIQLVGLPLLLVFGWVLASTLGHAVFLFLIAALIALLLDPLVRALRRVPHPPRLRRRDRVLVRSRLR